MKKPWNRVVLLSLLCGARLCAGEEARMTADDRARALQFLEDSQKEFLSAIDGVTELQWSWKPAADRWSIAEISEHIVLAEAALFEQVNQAISSPLNPAWEEKTKGKTAMLESILAGRKGKAQAPESIAPKSKLTQVEVKERFNSQRVKIVRFTTETELPLKQYTVNNPFFGPLNGYQWLIYGPLHTMRHDKQIAEVKNTAGYPE